MAKNSPGRPRSEPATATEFSKWFAGALAGSQLTKAQAAERLSVDPSVVYDWLAGKDPRMSGLLKPGILAALRASARPSQPASAGANLPAPSEEEMKQIGPLWEKFVDVIKHRDGKAQQQFDVIESLLRHYRITPKPATGQARRRISANVPERQ